MKYIDVQAMTLTESVTLDGEHKKIYSAGTISSEFYEVGRWHNVRLFFIVSSTAPFLDFVRQLTEWPNDQVRPTANRKAWSSVITCFSTITTKSKIDILCERLLPIDRGYSITTGTFNMPTSYQ